jgi:hypothetical protein
VLATVYRTLDASFMTGAAACASTEDPPLLTSITCVGSMSECDFPSNLTAIYLGGRLDRCNSSSEVSILRAKDAVLSLKLIGMTSTPEDFT